MAKILIVFASMEGHSERIAGLIGDHLTRARHLPTLLNAASDAAARPNLHLHDAVIVVAPVHHQTHHPAIVRFANRFGENLTKTASALVSVSLHAASGEADDEEEMRQYVDILAGETRWLPRAVHYAAGALKFSEFDFFKRWMAKRLVNSLELDADPKADVEFTDWPALYAFVDDFLAVHVGE